MNFKVINWRGNKSYGPDTLVLECDNWDDYTFKTTFNAYHEGNPIGAVKIAFKGMAGGGSTAIEIPSVFDELPEQYFSVWQSEKAYQAVCGIEPQPGEIFQALRDIAYDVAILDSVKDEPSLRSSLLRSVTEFACRGQFHRIAHGGAQRVEYHFTFRIEAQSIANAGTVLSFDVNPDDFPPSNIHAIIGKNGVGKTTLIQDFVLSACDKDVPFRKLEYMDSDEHTSMQNLGSAFANVICVSFSPFDAYDRVTRIESREEQHAVADSEAASASSPKCHYIGLDRSSAGLLESIEEDFAVSFLECLASSQKLGLWGSAMDELASDSAFAEIRNGIIGGPLGRDLRLDRRVAQARSVFRGLSSGHKVVMTIITSCVNMLEERSIVLLDEPENHLHPPLLAAFIRALSFLMADRNSVAVFATHSPVVLQEIPRSCVWILARQGDCWSASRPQIETFGANLGSLTNQVFKLEVDASGFHKLLEEAVRECATFEDAVNRFGGKLGDEADALLRMLWSRRAEGVVR